MLHFYDTPPATEEYIHSRLRPARTLLAKGIPFVVWGDDALCFVHFVPTVCFAFTVLVPDNLVQAAVDGIKDDGYEEIPQSAPQLLDDGGQVVMRDAVLLGRKEELRDEGNPTPGQVFIIPQSAFHFNVHDKARIQGLISPYNPADADVRFPTLPAFFDALIDTLFALPNASNYHYRWSYLGGMLSDLVLYNARIEDSLVDSATNELHPNALALLQGVREDNKPWLKKYIRTASVDPSELGEEAKRVRDNIRKSQIM